MKIITNDAAYVQMNDLMHLNQSDLPIPASVFMKVFGHGIVIIDNSNRFEFAKFEEDDDIEFFKNIDWIVDYYDVKELSVDDIIEVANGVNEQRNKIAEKYNAMNAKDRATNQRMRTDCELLNNKFYGLRDFVWWRDGHIKFDLPQGIEYPTTFKSDVIDGTAVVVEDEKTGVEKEDKGIKKFFKTIFRRG